MYPSIPCSTSEASAHTSSQPPDSQSTRMRAAASSSCSTSPWIWSLPGKRKHDDAYRSVRGHRGRTSTQSCRSAAGFLASPPPAALASAAAALSDAAPSAAPASPAASAAGYRQGTGAACLRRPCFGQDACLSIRASVLCSVTLEQILKPGSGGSPGGSRSRRRRRRRSTHAHATMEGVNIP